jgi:hypothetical protein
MGMDRGGSVGNRAGQVLSFLPASWVEHLSEIDNAKKHAGRRLHAFSVTAVSQPFWRSNAS